MELPVYCWWCGAVLAGGLTQHHPKCWVRTFIDETVRKAMVDECTCRTCGHPASAHIGGSCFECGRARCWS